MNIGYFISSHGFGHASRACAVMEKLSKIGQTNFFIFTSTPDWFFKNSLLLQYEYIATRTDVGLVQVTPFIEDISKTIKALENFIPFSDIRYAEFLRFVSKKKLDLILCDISPLGLWIAKKLGIPSILVENFTWDWIYDYYLKQYPKLDVYISIMREFYQLPDLHFTCDPYSVLSKNSIIVSPVYREPRSSREKTRKQLKVNDEDQLVLVTMGGIPVEHIDGSITSGSDNIKFLIPIKNVNTKIETKNIIYVSHNHPYFHPDLVNASDLVIGKLGYSTVVEVYSLAKPFLYIGRNNFRESKVLEKFVCEKLISDEIELNNIISLFTLDKIQNLISKTQWKNQPINGADQIANGIWEKFY